MRFRASIRDLGLMSHIKTYLPACMRRANARKNLTFRSKGLRR